MISSTSGIVITGGIFNNISQTKRGFDLLLEWVAPGAFHNSNELYDAPKCHPHTRVAVLDDIMKWVTESEALDEFIMWLFGPAGAGKSAIAKKIAELAADKGLLIGTFFFFSRTSPTRNTQDRLIATLAYQLSVCIPGTRTFMEDAIERDPAIFHKNIDTQIDTLLIQPFQSASTQITPSPKLIIIDGLDECNNSKAQAAILDAISHSFSKHKIPMICLVVSRPETDIVASFNANEPLKSIHRRLALDDTYHPNDDIRMFFSDKFEQIRCTHRLRSTILAPWPTQESLEALVKKSSGQFIFAATVVRFVESNRHRPVARLNVILGISPAGTMNPFAELDGLYKQILSSVDDIQLTLHVLSLYTAAPSLVDLRSISESAELLLCVEEGDIDLALFNLSSIVSYNESSGQVKILHASLVDFLSDKHRSNEFHIDMASSRANFACRTLQYVKGPDGIRAGDLDLFEAVFLLDGLIHSNGQHGSDILNFDFDAFITAAIKYRYKEHIRCYGFFDVIHAFPIWMDTLDNMGFEDKDKQETLYRCKNSFEARVQKYQTDCQLQLLLTLAAIVDHDTSRGFEGGYQVPECRRLDILLEIDDHDLHLVDQDALDLRHNAPSLTWYPQLIDIIFLYVDGERYTSAALHCISFLSNPPKYSKIGFLIEWKETCNMALNLLCSLLKQANTSLELIQFMSNHDINSAVRKSFSVIRVWELDTHILAFLSRASVCVNWRIISAIQQALFATDEQPSKSKDTDARPEERKNTILTPYLMPLHCCDHCYVD